MIPIMGCIYPHSLILYIQSIFFLKRQKNTPCPIVIVHHSIIVIFLVNGFKLDIRALLHYCCHFGKYHALRYTHDQGRIQRGAAALNFSNPINTY